jgi:hypothetical protein
MECCGRSIFTLAVPGNRLRGSNGLLRVNRGRLTCYPEGELWHLRKPCQSWTIAKLKIRASTQVFAKRPLCTFSAHIGVARKLPFLAENT